MSFSTNCPILSSSSLLLVLCFVSLFSYVSSGSIETMSSKDSKKVGMKIRPPVEVYSIVIAVVVSIIFFIILIIVAIVGIKASQIAKLEAEEKRRRDVLEALAKAQRELEGGDDCQEGDLIVIENHHQIPSAVYGPARLSYT